MSSSSTKSKNKWVLATWNGQALVPYASYDKEMMEELPNGVPVRLQFAQPRSLPRHRLYRVVLRQVVKNSDLFATEDALHKTLLVGCGVVEPVITVDNDIIMIPSSTAFDAMEEDEFKKYFDQAMQIICTKIIPGLDIDDLLDEAKRESNWREAA
jgi:hypothetical protein